MFEGKVHSRDITKRSDRRVFFVVVLSVLLSWLLRLSRSPLRFHVGHNSRWCTLPCLQLIVDLHREVRLLDLTKCYFCPLGVNETKRSLMSITPSQNYPVKPKRVNQTDFPATRLRKRVDDVLGRSLIHGG